MLNLASHFRIVGLMVGLVVLISIGCGKSPIAPDNMSTRSSLTLASAGTELELFGRVASVDPINRLISLVSESTVIVVSDSAEIVRKGSGSDIAITLDEINPGDSAEIRGDVQLDGSLLANRVRIRSSDNEGPEVELAGRVESIDTTARTLALVGISTPIIVAADAQIVQKSSGMTIPISLSDILPGDSLEVRGNMQPDSTLLANRLRLRDNDDFNADVEFTDVIATIDYSAGLITVEGRVETIVVDSNTLIFVRSSIVVGLPAAKSGPGSGGDGGLDDDPRLGEPIEITDLHVGDTIEVHADRIDGTTLLAIVIELEDGAFVDQMEVQFKDTLATVDTAAMSVSFQNETWVGIIADGAELEGLMGETLTLVDFGPNELVEVKGFEIAADTLLIVRMRKDNN